MNHIFIHVIIAVVLITQSPSVASYLIPSRNVLLPRKMAMLNRSTTTDKSRVKFIAMKHFPPYGSNHPFSRNIFLRQFFSFISVSNVLISSPIRANADLKSAADAGLPLLGRFEALKGAKGFIGQWNYMATTGIPAGILVFSKNGEVELRSATSSDIILAVGAVPWKYRAVKGSNSLVIVTFTLDQNEDDVFIYQGTLNLENEHQITMKGTIYIGRAEIGARGSGPRKEIGSFSAHFIYQGS